ncbi:MAG: ATP synthase F1 subunit delta [Alphaproteobacteria bacterium]
MATQNHRPHRPLARRYALALYRSAKNQKNESKDFDNIIKGIIELLRGDDEGKTWYQMAVSPFLSLEHKKNIISKLLDAQKINDKKNYDLLANFLNLLLMKGRLPMAIMILDETSQMLQQDQGQVIAIITTAKPLANGNKKILEEELITALPKILPKNMDKKIDKNLTMSYRIDKTLLGGLTIMVESYNIDLSVKSKLQKLEQQLTK